MNKPEVTIYTRQGCQLCDDAYDLMKRYGYSPDLVDIDRNHQLRDRYDTCVPVVFIDGKERFRGIINEFLLQRLMQKD